MPKKLDHVRETAIAETRYILETQGYGALTMRDIAKKCQVAVGTMYNYFPSKEYLTGCVVLEDWKGTCDKMTGAIAEADTFANGLHGIYDLMYEFVLQHQYLTTFDGGNPAPPYDYQARHMLLLGQVEALLQLLEERFSDPLEGSIRTFLAESILAFSVKKYPYAQIAPAFMKLLAKG